MAIKYPGSIDDTISIPPAVDGQTGVSASVVNTLRSAILAVESELGVQPSTTYGTVRARLDTIEGAISSLTGISLTGGDLGGTISVPRVVGLRGTPIANITPTDGYVLAMSGGQWTPVPNTSGATLSGDVTGSSGANTVVRLQNRNVANTAPTDGYVLTWNQSLTRWQPSPSSGGGTLAGDVTGAASSNTVAKFQGRSFASTAPTDQQAIIWDQAGSTWKPATIPGGSLIGDVNGLASNNTVTKLQNRNLASTAPTDGYVISWDQAGTTWKPTPPVFPTDGYSALTFKPGGTSSATVFTSWSALMTKRATLNSPVTIIIDDSITSPALIPSGTWNLGKNTAIVGYKGNDGATPVVLQIPQGAQLQNPSEFRNIKILGAATSTATIVAASPFTSLDIYARDVVFRTLNTATASLIQSTRGFITLDGYSKFENISNGVSVLSGTLGADLYINLNDRSQIDAHTTNLQGGFNVNIFINSGAANYSSTQDGAANVNIFGANFISNLNSAPDGYVLSKNGAGQSLWIPGGGFGLVLSGDVNGPIGTNNINNSVITNTKIRDSAGLSVIGRSTNSTGTVADITGTDGLYLRVSGTSLGFGTINLGNASSFIGTLTSSLQDSQIMGGDVSGSTSVATVVKLQGRDISLTAPSDGYALVWNAGGSVWTPTAVVTGTMGGDVTGTTAANTVTKFQNRSFASTSPLDGYVIGWDEAENTWKPVPATSGTTLSGDVTGAVSANTVTKLNGAPITTIGAANTVVGTTDGTNITYFQIVNAQVSSSAAIVGTKISPNFGSQNILTTGGIFLGTSSATSGLIGVPHANDFLQGRNSTGLGNIILMNWGGFANRLTVGSNLVADGYYNVASSGNYVFQFNSIDKYKWNSTQSDWGGNKLVNLGSPSISTDAANKGYVDGYSFSSLVIAGDVTGTLAATSTVKLQGNAVQSGTLSATQDGYALVWVNGSSQWQAKPVLTAVSLGGDVTGSANSNTVVKLQNRTLASTAPNDGYTIIWNSGSSTWVIGNHEIDMGDQKIVKLATPTISTDAATKGYVDGYSFSSLVIAGDVTGTLAASTVAKIQGNNVQSGALSALQDGYALVWVNGSSQWQAKPIITSVSLGGDVTGTAGANTVVKLQNRTLASTAPSDGYTIIWDNGSSTWVIGNHQLDMGTQKIVKVGTPTTATDAATKEYVDGYSFSTLAIGGDLTGTIGNAQIVSGVIVDTDINSAANITVSKISPSTTDGYYLNTTSGVTTWKSLATNSLLGRDTGGTGGLEPITLDSTLEFSGSQTIGRAALTGDISASAGSNTTAIGANKVLNSMIRQSAGLSVIGRGANSTGDVSDITATATGQVLRYSGTTIGFGALDLADADAVTGSLPIANQVSQNMLGDVTGTTATSTVVKLQNRTLSSSAPTDGYVLTWDSGSSTWITTGHFIDTGSPSNYLKFGGGSSTTGAIRLPNNGQIKARTTDGYDRLVISLAADNTTYVGDQSTTEINLQASTLMDVVLAGSNEFRFTTTTADFNSNNLINVSYIRFPGSGVSSITDGYLRIPHGVSVLQGVNGVGNNWDQLIRWGSSATEELMFGGGSFVDSIRFRTKSGATGYNFEVGTGVVEYSFNATTLDCKSNTITNLSALNTITVALGVKGSNLTDANLTKNVTDGYIFELPASTLSTARTFTGGLTGAINGLIMSIRRFDTSANTYTIKNNGGVTLFTMPPSQKYQCDIRYNSAIIDWELGGAWGLA